MSAFCLVETRYTYHTLNEVYACQIWMDYNRRKYSIGLFLGSDLDHPVYVEERKLLLMKVAGETNFFSYRRELAFQLSYY